MTRARRTIDWGRVAERIRTRVRESRNSRLPLLESQARSLIFIADRLPEHGVVIADEVGLGKTRIACEIMAAVLECGGRVAAAVPPGLLDQWKTEFQHFIHPTGPKARPCPIRSFNELVWKVPGWPVAGKEQWPLISHNLVVPRFQRASPVWRMRLPALIRCHGDDRSEDGRTKLGHWRSEYGPDGAPDDRAAQYLARVSTPALVQAIQSLPLPRTGDRSVPEAMQGPEGREAFREIIRLLLGSVDLLVIDEAHKSRETDGAAPEKMLGTLIAELIPRSRAARAIALTATPVELGPHQWSGVLERVGARIDQNGRCRIEDFVRALQAAQSDADVVRRLDDLEKAAEGFRRTLAPFVTRRRRIYEPEMIRLKDELLRRDGNVPRTHFHRDYVPCPIEWSALTPNWRKVALALEGRGLAAKGTDLGASARLSDIRYSSGHVGFDIETDVDHASQAPPTDPEDAKLYRADFWLRRAAEWSGAGCSPSKRSPPKRSASKRPSAKSPELRELWSHPRIVKAVERVEFWTGTRGPDGQYEKVLVFGTFTKPMLALQSLLNARHMLRALDERRPLFPEADMTSLREAWHLARDDFKGQLAGINDAAFQLLVTEHKHAYTALRERISKTVSREFLIRQEGAAAIRELGGGLDRILPHLRLTVAEALLQSERWEKESELTPQTIQDHAMAIWRDWLESCVALHEAPGDVDMDEGIAQGGRLGRPAQRLESRLLSQLVDEEVQQQHSRFCRLMDGDMKPTQRRLVQAAFNRPGSLPRVVIGQSRVAREGLNLHGACRIVLLFHPEWNPGVMEQQIGRVDRIGGRWHSLAKAWERDGAGGEMPRIVIEMLAFQGTYDESQIQRLTRRRMELEAQLFGALLPEEKIATLSPEWRKRLAAAAPDFSPPE